MKKVIFGILIVTLIFLLIYIFHAPKATDVISAHIGKTYDDVVQDSTFPVKSKTVIYPSEQPEPDSTWISSPVIVKFDDPQYGFILPPTIFGAVSYNGGKVITITTSPMLETVTFDQLTSLLNSLQEMLKNAGWVLRDNGRNRWFSVSNEADQKALQSLLFSQAESVTLLIPHKYMLVLIAKCYARCSERDPNTARYLIDVSVGMDFSNVGKRANTD